MATSRMRRSPPGQWNSLVWSLLILLCGIALVMGQRAHNSRESYTEKSSILAPSHRELIVGGATADPTRYPYFVALKFLNSPDFGCAGALVAPDVVLSNSECFGGSDILPTSWNVWVNRTKFLVETGKEYRRQVSKIVIHPSFTRAPNTLIPNWDFALLKLKTAVVGVPTLAFNTRSTVPSAGQALTAIGLGSVANGQSSQNSPVLRDVVINAVAFSTCRASYASVGDTVVDANMICAGASGKDTCDKDGGAPLIVKGARPQDDVLVGVASWGPLEGCAIDGFPGVYAKVSGVADWLKDSICNLTSTDVSFCRVTTSAPTSAPTLARTLAPTSAPTSAPNVAPTPTSTSAPTPTPTSAPTPTPTSAPAFVCFSQETSVVVKNRGTVPMKDLQLGDQVMVATNKYEPVYSFGHRSVDVSAQYLKFSPSNIELSPDHMVFVQDKGAIPASLVTIGDEFLGGQAVTAIRNVTSRGAYAPFTPSGTIMVNGVQASSFVAFQNSAELMLGSVSTGLNYHWLAHLFELPHRVWCYHLGVCSEHYTENGVSTWVNRPHKMAQCFISMGMVGKIFVLIPLALIVAMLSLVQLVLLYPGGLGVMAAIGVGSMFHLKIRCPLFSK